MTAASGHITVLLKEAVEALNIRPDGCYVDATFGRGGHSREILSRLGPAGRLVAFDRDPQAVAAGRLIDDRRFALHHQPFSALAEVLAAEADGRFAVEGAVAGMGVVDGILFDLGVSSPQLDEEERGFSFRTDGPLDMRMDTTQGETAAEWLERASVGDITEVIRNHGEERFAFQIAKKIVAARSERRIATTGQLATLVAEAVRTREPGQDPATRTFQALRIHVNQELAQLALTLPLAFKALKDGGRLVVISFHSLEDRIVKRFVQAHAVPDRAPKKLPLRADQLPQPDLRPVGKPLRPSAAETAANPRARSAIMRVAEKLGSTVAGRV